MSGFVRDPELCEKYAQFASHLVRWQFKIIYWTLFITNLFVLFLASWTYIRGQESVEKYGDAPKKRRKKLKLYIYLCLLCVMVSSTIIVMEAYSLLALQFCDGEDLMSLYWSTWTMIQVGSLIAMMGIILAMVHSLKNRRHPPWALALGTPVLVIAGVLHLFHDITRHKFRKFRSARRATSEDEAMGPPMSQVNTVQAPDDDEDDAIHGEFIGFTVEGGPIIRFTNRQFANASFPGNAELIGYCNDDRPIVAYRKDSVKFVKSTDAEPCKETKEEDLEKGTKEVA